MSVAPTQVGEGLELKSNQLTSGNLDQLSNAKNT